MKRGSINVIQEQLVRHSSPIVALSIESDFILTFRIPFLKSIHCGATEMNLKRPHWFLTSLHQTHVNLKGLNYKVSFRTFEKQLKKKVISIFKFI